MDVDFGGVGFGVGFSGVGFSGVGFGVGFWGVDLIGFVGDFILGIGVFSNRDSIAESEE
jgi:hypothetical protein